MSDAPPFGFIETADGLVWGTDKSDPRVDVVIYHQIDDDSWAPFSVFKRSGGGGLTEFDCDWVGGELYFHESGGGGRPYVGRLANWSTLPGRIWVRDGVTVHDGWAVGEPALDDQALLERGFLRIDGAPSPFEWAIEGRTFYCAACRGDVHDDEGDQCCLCEEWAHVHLGSLIAVVDSDARLELGLHEVTEFPFFMSGMIGTGRFLDRSLRWLAALPENVDTNGYASGPLCADCSREWSYRASRWPHLTAQLNLFEEDLAHGPSHGPLPFGPVP